MAECEQCGGIVEFARLEGSTAIGRCSACSHETTAEDGGASLERPLPKAPWGVRFTDDGEEVVIRASTATWAALLFVPLVSAVTVVALGLIYGAQILNGRFNLLASLLGLPFIAASAVLWMAAIMMIAGRVELRLRGLDGSVFSGVGPVGFRKRFDWGEVRSVRTAPVWWWPKTMGSPSPRAIHLDSPEPVRFGTPIPEGRKMHVVGLLQRLLVRLPPPMTDDDDSTTSGSTITPRQEARQWRTASRQAFPGWLRRLLKRD